MNCEELMAALNEYVDGNVDLPICEEFKKHLEGCNPCQIVIDNIRQTITLYKDGQAYELPAAFHEKLSNCLKERWKEKFPAAKL